jgi:hypothetical protein
MRVTWETVAIGQAGATAVLAGLAAAHFLGRHAREGDGRTRTAALALALCTTGAAALTLHGLACGLASETASWSWTALFAGLPSLAGQALLALLVLRRVRS